MLYTIPDYYHEFSCIAGECEDTCCAGWQIVADEAALKKYKKVTGSFRKRLRRSINWKEGTFKQDKNKRCAFLNDENLCVYCARREKPVPDLQDVSETRRRIRRCPGDDAVCILSGGSKNSAW